MRRGCDDLLVFWQPPETRRVEKRKAFRGLPASLWPSRSTGASASHDGLRTQTAPAEPRVRQQRPHRMRPFRGPSRLWDPTACRMSIGSHPQGSSCGCSSARTCTPTCLPSWSCEQLHGGEADPKAYKTSGLSPLVSNPHPSPSTTLYIAPTTPEFLPSTSLSFQPAKPPTPAAMLSTVYVACLLATAAFATPTTHAPRGFAQYSQDAASADRSHASQASSTPWSNSMSSSDTSNSVNSHNSGSVYNGGLGNGLAFGGDVDPGFGGAAGFGNFQGGGYNAMSANSANANSFQAGGYQAGGLGGFGAGGSSFSSSQQSSSVSSVSSSFQSLNGLIGGFQSQLAAGQLTRDLAFQRCQQLAQSLQAVLSQATNCATCFNIGQFGSIASSTLIQFTNFVSSLQTSFDGSAFSRIASPLSGLTSSFQQFFQRTSASSAISTSSLIPQNFGPVFQGIMPSVVQQFSANSFNQQSSSNSFQAGGFGAGGSSFSSSQQSSSVSSVSSSFQSLNGLIGGFQSQLAAGQLTRDIAFQRCQQLARSFQAVLSQANNCGTCFKSPGQFGSIASSTFSQFTNFVSSLQTSFGGDALSQIASPLASLSSSFQQFYQRTSASSAVSSTSIFPQDFASVMQPIMPSLGPVFQQSAFQKK
ncbi:hypothetical protein PtB15_7B394 [Puccinia triticina]|nr:hypothetical protein PtB15_7B394 [Puccinia triticina]